MQVLAPMTGLSLARVSNRQRGHRTQNHGCHIDAGSNPVASTIEEEKKNVMNTPKKKPTAREKRLARKANTAVTCESVGLDPVLYASALRYLFDRPVPAENEEEWFWNIDEPEFEATPLQWVHIQTVLFANAGTDLEPYSDEQVGMGLNYVMSNSVSDVPHMVNESSVPLADAMRMMKAFPMLWRECIGPRMGDAQQTGREKKRLGFACFNWFDVWPSFRNAKHIPEWRDAMWNVLCDMLSLPWRDVQLAALDSLADDGCHLERPDQVQALIDAFLRKLRGDEELRTFALHAASMSAQAATIR